MTPPNRYRYFATSWSARATTSGLRRGGIALISLNATTPELILLDIAMPGINGFEVCRRLKAKRETRGYSGDFPQRDTDTKDRVEGLRLGAVDFVSKPFEKEELLVRIQTHLELSRLRSGLERIVAERTTNLQSANRRLRLELIERIRESRRYGKVKSGFAVWPITLRL